MPRATERFCLGSPGAASHWATPTRRSRFTSPPGTPTLLAVVPLARYGGNVRGRFPGCEWTVTDPATDPAPAPDAIASVRPAGHERDDVVEDVRRGDRRDFGVVVSGGDLYHVGPDDAGRLEAAQHRQELAAGETPGLRRARAW